MASEERPSIIVSSKSKSKSSKFNYDEYSLSPNGPLSDLNYGSCYSSTSGSEMGSPETENDEDEVLLAELTRRMAEFTFEGESEGDEDEEEDGKSGKSAATSLLNDNYNNNYSQSGGGGYNTSSSGYNYNQAIKCASKQPTVDSALPRNPNADIFPAQIYPMRNQQQLRTEVAECGKRSGNKTVEQKDHHRGGGGTGCKMQDKKAWRSPAQNGVSFSNSPLPNGGSGMRAVFLNASKSDSNISSGTGVFIPNTNFNKSDPKKKTGCSTVLIPARVLQTLQQHFNNVGAKSQSQNTQVSTDQPWKNDVLARINGLLSQQQGQVVFKIQPAETAHDQEYTLPPEWTY